MKRTYRMLSVLSVVALGTFSLSGCGDGGGDDDGTPLGPPVAAVVSGSMNKGSVIVNGVKFEDTGAQVLHDEGRPSTPAGLADGMTVNVRGTVNADEVTGKADLIGVENELRGNITSIDGTDSFTALGQKVFVDGQTVFAGGVSNLAGLVIGNDVEVHGTRDTAGAIRATRVERTEQVDHELRGPVSQSGPTGFSIGGMAITRDANTVVIPQGATFQNGDVVEVHLTGTLAIRIEVEKAENEFEPAEGQHFRVEGFVTGRDGAGDNAFEVKGQPVQLASGARFEGGLPADLANDVKVEAEGHRQGNVLLANKIKFKDPIRIEANASTINAVSGNLSLLGKTVTLTEKTDNRAGALSAIAAGTGLRIRGFLNRDNSTITATRIDALSNPVGAGDEILQGPVSSFSASGRTMTILGITVTASGAQRFRDDRDDDDSPSGDQPISSDQFFGMLTPDRTIVKAKGTLSGTNFTAREVEIE
jgi:hypothetical protein